MEKLSLNPYPERVECGDRIYDIDLRFLTILQIWDVQSSDDWTYADKIELQTKLFLADPDDCPDSIEDQIALLNAIYALFPRNAEESNERYIDFHQDAAMIRSAFFRIGVDLTKSHIHFFQFLELLADLPEDTALMRTIKIRMEPIPKCTEHNREQIAALQKAKAKVAIKMSEEERRRRFAESIRNSSFLRG